MKKSSKKQKRTLDTSTQTLGDRVISWRTARTSLATAIKAFHAASVSLDVAYAHLPPTQRGNARRLLRLDPQLASLESDIAMLCRSKQTLSEMRNPSTGAVLINALPLDVLAEIFRHTAPGCVRPRDSNHRPHHPVVVSAVCSYWRRVAISVPALWSHIDFQVTLARGKHYDTPVTWIERSKSHPLTIHIYDQGQLGYQAPRTDEVARLLRPFVFQIASLHVHNEYGRTLEKTLQSLLTPLLKGKAPLESLYLTQSAYTYAPDHLSVLFPLPLPIRTLSLTYTYPNWTNPLFQGLTYLRLEYPRNNGWNSIDGAMKFTIADISTALSASSMLKTLIIVRPTIQGVPKSSNHGFVHLEHLEILSLQEVTGLSLNLLLPILAPGPGNLRMEISLEHTPPFGPAEQAPVDFTKQLNNFFSRTCIETLKLVSASSFGKDNAPVPPGWRIDQLTCLKYLELHAFGDLSGLFKKLLLKSIPVKKGGSGKAKCRLPSLKGLRIVNCTIQPEPFCALVKAASLRELILSTSCRVMDKSGIAILHRTFLNKLSPFIPYVINTERTTPDLS